MRKHLLGVLVGAAASTLPAVLAGCGQALETQRPFTMAWPEVNAEAARHLSEGAVNDAQSLAQLMASDRFGAVIYQQYVDAVFEEHALAALHAEMQGAAKEAD